MSLRVIVGISGASGAAIGLRILERLAEAGTVETEAGVVARERNGAHRAA